MKCLSTPHIYTDPFLWTPFCDQRQWESDLFWGFCVEVYDIMFPSMSFLKTESGKEAGCKKFWKGMEHELYQVANLLHNVDGKMTATPVVTTICLSPTWSKMR